MKLHRQHNVTELQYHLIAVVKYRKKLINKELQTEIVNACKHIQDTGGRIWFLEIGANSDHVHFLVQAKPILSPTQIATTIKGVTGKHLFYKFPELRTELRKHEFWTNGYYMSTVSVIPADVTRWYVKNQAKKLSKL
jgi:REP element-mobilizing transposase RayT